MSDDFSKNPIQSGFADPNVAQRVMGAGTDANPADANDTDSNEPNEKKTDPMAYMKVGGLVGLMGMMTTFDACSVMVGLPGITS